MSAESMALSLAPPLRMLWRSGTTFAVAVAGNGSVYGITPAGKLVALNTADGAQRWASVGTYLPTHLVRQGSRLAAYRVGEGMAYIDDDGTSASERLSLSFGAAPGVNLSPPVFDGQMVYVAANQGLYAADQQKGVQFGSILSETVPHTALLLSSREIIVVDGKGVPTRYHVGEKGFTLVWTGASNGVEAGQSERPCTISGNRLIVGVGSDTVAYDLGTGQVSWRLGNVPARAFAVIGGTVYAAFLGSSLWAIRAADGAVLWQRQYLYNLSIQRECGLATAGDYLYFGGNLQTNPDGAILLAVRASDGAFAWLSRSATGPWAAGIPVADGAQLYTFGAPYTAGFGALSISPRVGTAAIELTPRPLRGAVSGFGAGRFNVSLPVPARISVAAYRELQGPGKRIVDGADWSPGSHEVSWNIGGTDGFSDASQFGYVLVDVAERGGPSYTQAMLLPINTFPDILWHWSRGSIESMVYHQYVNGYADQTFKPNNLVTRAESCAIIAKTLKLEGPSPGFKSKLKDITNHWARTYIMALEEKGILGGFAEPDGTFTFRPELDMTRGQEARILVKAYGIPAAAPSFTSKFTDIAGHWASADIKALEAAGYVSGFQEANGTFTYRPERNLTRAELCTVVVRILKLIR